MCPLLPFGAAIALPRQTALNGLVEPGRLHEAIPARTGAEPAALGFLLGLAQQWSGRSLFWVREQTAAAETGELYGPGLQAFGLDPAHCILVDVRKRMDALWAAEQGLRVENLTVLLELSGRDKPIDLTGTRRLTLACEKSGATALILRGDIVKAPTTPSAAWTRWAIMPAPSMSSVFDEVGASSLSATLLRHRAGPAGARFDIDWNDHVFTATRKALGSDLAAPTFDRPDRQRLVNAR